MKEVKRSIDWSEGRWTNEPLDAKSENGHLIVKAAKGSDYWQKTVYGFEHDSGHALLAPWPAECAMEVTLRLDQFSNLFDQAGLMLWRSPVQWIKTGVEFSDGILCIGAVVTDDYSDWSLFPVPVDWLGGELTLRASLLNDGVIIRAKTKKTSWQTIRVARFPYREDIKAGPHLAAPSEEGFRAIFTKWELTDLDTDIHIDPPL